MRSKAPIKGVLGLGAVSTQYYLQQIHEKFQHENKEYSTCPLILYQIDFQEINPFLPNKFSDLIPQVKDYLEKIFALGIKKLLVPNITLHETLDQMDFPLEVYHPVSLTLNYLQEKNVSKAFLFGTSYTMNSDYLRRNFDDKDVTLLKPSNEDQEWIDHFRTMVYEGNVATSDSERFHETIKKYAASNPVLIACTELSLHARKNDDSCIDMAELQIEAFLK
ncbi:hypothetical protein L0B70_05690 [Kaistella sp. 97-N-M2]|uniref:aspartate/glutamate racemase family protein n=1 Tax=Kaistella sp. 97-N-M2 TaxID=2908645 RepID=UPI001F2CA2D4|nr:hypothetical protein [Kaistella sp. 97-N-M2]UJF30868.1 hypothetical protein L0B70_05690 [Kaistella sp. 97-N-M2]